MPFYESQHIPSDSRDWALCVNPAIELDTVRGVFEKESFSIQKEKLETHARNSCVPVKAHKSSS